jgi:GTPase SAR1 family protein
LRPEWTAYLTPNAIIFVVDSADITLGDGANNLAHLLNEECVREASDAPLLVFANKQDLKGAKSPVEIAEALHLRELSDRRWNIAPCSATDGVGISGGMDWLVVSTYIPRIFLNPMFSRILNLYITIASSEISREITKGIMATSPGCTVCPHYSTW